MAGFSGLDSYQTDVVTSRMDLMYAQMKQRMPQKFLPKEKPLIRKYWSRKYLDPAISPINADQFPFMRQIVKTLSLYNANAESSLFFRNWELENAALCCRPTTTKLWRLPPMKKNTTELSLNSIPPSLPPKTEL